MLLVTVLCLGTTWGIFKWFRLLVLRNMSITWALNFCSMLDIPVMWFSFATTSQGIMLVLGLQLIRIPLCISLSPHLPNPLHQKYPSLDGRYWTSVHTKIISFLYMNKKDVPGRLMNKPEQFGIFFSKVQLLFDLKEQCGVVVLLLDSAQDSCPGPLNKTNIDGFCCHQRPTWSPAVCLERERTLRGWVPAEYPQLICLV